MAEPIEVRPGVVVPSSALEARAVRSSGPGGQNVNKVASKVELLVDVAAVEGLDEAAALRLVRLAGRRLGADGRLRVTAQESRDRTRNLESAREKVRDLLDRALVTPKRRRKTRPSAAAREQRLGEKKRVGRVKSTRGGVRDDE
jgi:ribosome-associated protein